MKTIRIHKYGGPEKVIYEDIAQIPNPGANQVLVRIKAASLNPVDYRLASGRLQNLSLPWIPGADFAGIVESVGNGVSGFRKGDAVFGNSPDGGAYSEYIAVNADSIVAMPSCLDFIQAASVPLAGQAAWQGLFEYGKLQAGQKVLIHGAAGGVGTFAVQLAHWKGAQVFATASTCDINYLDKLGAQGIINYHAIPFESVVKNMDLVFDLIGGNTQARLFIVIKEGGRLISAIQQPSNEEAEKRKIFTMMMHVQPLAKRLSKLVELLDKGKIKTFISRTYTLAQAKGAWTYVINNHKQGKIVLVIP